MMMIIIVSERMSVSIVWMTLSYTRENRRKGFFFRRVINIREIHFSLKFIGYNHTYVFLKTYLIMSIWREKNLFRNFFFLLSSTVKWCWSHALVVDVEGKTSVCSLCCCCCCYSRRWKTSEIYVHIYWKEAWFLLLSL